MGVVVNETTIETAIAALIVTANSRKSCPMMPAIIRIGIKTATSETLIDRTVNPISRGNFPKRRRLHRTHAPLDVAGDVFDHNNRIIDHETGGNRERHQRKIVDTVAAEIHHAKRADERERHGDAGNERRGGRCAGTETRPGSQARSTA